MHKPHAFAIALTLAWALAPIASAQDQASTPVKQTMRERLLHASQLPAKTAEIRAQGVPQKDVKEAVDAAKSKRLPAGEMSEVADEQVKAIKEHGPIDNFGAFVKSKLNEGLRGRELAAAIRAEHAKRGKGKGFKPDAGPKAAEHSGKSKEAKDAQPVDRDKVKIKPAEKGKPKDKGKPDRKDDGGR